MRKDGLVALAIRIFIVATNIGRQRHVADAVEDGKKIADGFEAQQPFAEFAALKNLSLKFDFAIRQGKDQALADGDLSARPDQCAPEIFIRLWFGKQAPTSVDQRPVSRTSMRLGFSWSRTNVRRA
jgi:hypothetical protein